METYNVGDVVRLKSEDVYMVIERFLEENRVTCVWLDDEKSQKVGSFNTETLIHVEDNK